MGRRGGHHSSAGGLGDHMLLPPPGRRRLLQLGSTMDPLSLGSIASVLVGPEMLSAMGVSNGGGGALAGARPGTQASAALGPGFLANTLNSLGGTTWNTANTMGLYGGAALSEVGARLAQLGTALGGSSYGGYNKHADALAAAVAPGLAHGHSTVTGLVSTFAPLAQQAAADSGDLVAQGTAAVPDAIASLGSAAADVAFSIGPFLANGRTGLLDDAARAAALTGGAAAHVMHGTAVPMASDAIAVAADAGGRLGSGWREGFAEGHTAVMQRRSPYGPADTTEAAYAQQPALYLPSSYAPLGAMANITYPCPTGPFGSIAPSGTIIGPGIPCGVPLLMVPREAVPTNALGQAVVRLTPTNPPVRHT